VHLNQLRKQIIIIDNGSNEGQKNILASLLPGKEIIIRFLETNLGFGGGNNQAKSIAIGDILVFINNDTLLIDDSLLAGISWLANSSLAGIIGGNLLTNHHEPDISFGHMPLSIPLLFRFIINGLPFLPYKGMMSSVPKCNLAPFEIEVPMGALLIIKKADMDAIGWFDPEIFLYFEEADMVVRLRKVLNKKCFCHPGVRLLHLRGESSGKSIISDYYFKSWRYLLKKHKNGLIYFHLFKMILFCLLLRNIFVKILKRDKQKVIESCKYFASAINNFR
jgi:GT2 family glycosyltransferase